MPQSLRTLVALLVCGTFATLARAQQPSAALTIEDVPCSTCHTCEKPTSTHPCLGPCPRISAAVIAKELAEKEGPDLVILDELEDLFLPVPFDHKGHAEMAEMTSGCAVCHHDTPEGVAQPACKNCHEVDVKREGVGEMRKPSLKGAYHRQCMNCHRNWSHSTACEICHLPKARRGQEGVTTAKPGDSDIVGRSHPAIPEPDTEIYQRAAEGVPGTQIIFRHKDHIHRFGLKCVDCHQEESCSRCHELGARHEQRTRTLEEHHKPCSRCHDVTNKDACDRCHWKEGESEPEPFDHADTGWPLRKSHAALGCRICHQRVPFGRLKRECISCHAGWAPGTFDHAVTGQVLDDTHAEIECGECHRDRNFAIAPSCDECHEEDEGIAFPARRPGPSATPESPPQ